MCHEGEVRVMRGKCVCVCVCSGRESVCSDGNVFVCVFSEGEVCVCVCSEGEVCVF